jgi:hypothetical protein
VARLEIVIEREPYLPRFMAGGEGNPLGARALYLGNTRISRDQQAFYDRHVRFVPLYSAHQRRHY